MTVKPRANYPATFANGEPYPKAPPKNIEKVIELAVKTTWPFEMNDETEVEILVCSGVFPKEHGKNDIDHGAWYECEVYVDYSQSHSFSIESLQGLRQKVLDLAPGFRLESLSFETRPVTNPTPYHTHKIMARLTFADWNNLRLDKPYVPKRKSR